MSDDFTRGFLEGVDVAARIIANRIGGIRPVATEPTMGLGRPESPPGSTGAASGENHPPGDAEPVASTYPTDHPATLRRVMTKKFITQEAGAERWDVSVDTIRRLIASGQLTGYRLNGRIIRIDQDELDTCFKPIPTAAPLAPPE